MILRMPWFTNAGRPTGRGATAAPIFFLHMPKTAGTSIRQMLQATLGARAVYPSDHDLRRRADRAYPTTTEMLRILPGVRPYRVLIGHFTAGVVHDLPVPHRAATMLRDPVQRSLSMLAHLQRHHGLAPEAVMDSEELCVAHIADYQTALLGADGDRDLDAMTDARLDRALNNLAAFEFVGLTEQFAESCRRFDGLFGTTISVAIRRVNVLRPEGRGLERFIPRIEPLVARDRVLYERACTMFACDARSMASASGRLGRAA